MGRRTTLISLGCLGVLLALMGVRSAIAESGRTDVLLSFVLCSGMAVACIYDARRIGKVMPGAASAAVFITWPVAVPIYLVWSRGWKRGILAALVFVGSIMLLYLVPFCIAGYAVWGAAFFKTG